MNFYALFPTITSILFLVMGVYVYLKNRKNIVNFVYLLFCLSVFVWMFSFSMMYWSNTASDAYIFAKIGFIGILFIPVFMFHFVVAFLGKNETYKTHIKILYICIIPCMLIDFLTKWFYSGVKVCFWGYYPVAGKLYFLILLQFVVMFFYAISLLIKSSYNNSFSAMKQQQIKYLITAFIITSFGSVDYIAKYPIEIYPFAYILMILFIFVVAMCVIKYNLMDIKVVLTQTGILIILYACVLGVPFYIGLATEKWFFASIILFIFSTTGPVFFRYLQKKAGRILLSEQEKYQHLLVQASKGMVNQQDLHKLSNLIVRIINKNVKVQFVYLFIQDENREKYYCVASKGILGTNKESQIFADNIVIEYIKKIKKPFFFTELEDDLQKVFCSVTDGINLIVPSVLKDELIAFLILGDKINKSIYSSQDMEVFKTLSNQAGLAIENCYFLEKSKQQQKKLFEAEKLVSIGGMADGMAHQIKNRLNQFSMVSGEIGFEVDNFAKEYKSFIDKEPNVRHMVEYLKEMSDSISKNVKKTNNVLQGILNFAKTTEKDIVFSCFYLKEIIEQSVGLIRVKHQKEDIPLLLELPENDRLYGIKSQIQDVIFNCIDNAFEAILEKEEYLRNSMLENAKNLKENDVFIPKIKITLQYINKNARIYIKDNGIGIKTEHQPKIFSAFFTTKPSSRSGSGIGSYVVKRMIVENHKGDISFRSQYGVGSVFVITLPMGKV